MEATAFSRSQVTRGSVLFPVTIQFIKVTSMMTESSVCRPSDCTNHFQRTHAVILETTKSCKFKVLKVLGNKGGL